MNPDTEPHVERGGIRVQQQVSVHPGHHSPVTVPGRAGRVAEVQTVSATWAWVSSDEAGSWERSGGVHLTLADRLKSGSLGETYTRRLYLFSAWDLPDIQALLEAGRPQVKVTFEPA